MTALTTGQTADNRRKKIIVFSFILLMLVHVIFTFAGFYGDDDINYARYAADIVHNGISFSPALDQFQLRWATVYSAALMYRLFGINTFASTLPSTISLALCGILLYKILRYRKTGILFLSLVLFFFSRSVIFYSHRLLPDPTMCLAVFWMYYSYRSYSLKKQQHLWYGIQFSVALALAVITKETIIIALPLFFIFFLKDIFKRQNFQFWKIAILLSLIFSFAYLAYFRITTGDLFYRYSVLLKKSYFNECSFDMLPFIYALKRIGYELWRGMLLNGNFLVLLPGIASIIYRKKMGFTRIEKTDIFAFLILLCCANFMTISATSYVPLCQAPRHFMFLFLLQQLREGLYFMPILNNLKNTSHYPSFTLSLP
jgi:4-amino-4-deoxy-L-arabinose transferase-like glycosyltransferase